jgi:hypothetical protein
LGETIDIALESPEKGTRVGPFAADLVCKALGDEELTVVVENQFGKSDHDHLGKALTYAAGLSASTVVWIAEAFTDEHRQTLDWLNINASEGIRFFGLEIYLISVDDSNPAPQFRVVPNPNVWAQAARDASEDRELSQTKLDQKAFWEEMRDVFTSRRSALSPRKPLPQHWYEIAVGRSNFNISLTVNTNANRIGCELWMGGEKAKQAFTLLERDKEQIHAQFGADLDWQPLEGKKGCRIAIYKEASIYDPTDRQTSKDWLYQMAEKFFAVFGSRVKALRIQ